MTTPERENSDVTSEQIFQREIPAIRSEEDIPIQKSANSTTGKPGKQLIDRKLNETDDLEKEITRFRYSTGKTVLFIAMGAMLVMVAVDILANHYLNAASDLIESSFEAFKLITMTVLGYLFGSSGSNSGK